MAETLLSRHSLSAESPQKPLPIKGDVQQCGGCATTTQPAHSIGFSRGTATGMFNFPLILCSF